MNKGAQHKVLELLQQGHSVIVQGTKGGGEGKSYVLQQALEQGLVTKPLYMHGPHGLTWQEQIHKYQLPLQKPRQLLVFHETPVPQLLATNGQRAQEFQFYIMTNDHAAVQTWLNTDESARRYLTVLNADNGYQASPNPPFKNPLYLVQF